MGHLDSTRLTAEEMQQRARLTVCRYAADAAEAQEFMAMLGIIDSPAEERKPGECPVCGSELRPDAHQPRSGLRGTCSKACRETLYPTPDRHCERCDREMAEKPGEGQVHIGARGLCANCYHSDRRKGGFDTSKPVHVPADKAQTRIREWRDLGVQWLDMAAASGLARTTLIHIGSGKVRTVRVETEAAILAVTGIGEAVPT